MFPLVRQVLFLGWIVAFSTVVSGETLVPPNGPWRYFKGRSEASTPDRTAWRAVDFADGAWSRENAPFWYGDFPSSPGTWLNDMRNGYTCVFLRTTFTVDNVAAIDALELTTLSDDGCLVWINGREVLRYNMRDGDLPYNGTSLAGLPEPIPWVTNTLANPGAYLVPGNNVLAIQAFNSARNNSDFVIDAALSFRRDESAPALDLTFPPPGGTVRQLTFVEIGFDEAVTGVDATDLLLDGRPATRLITVAPDQYRFEFAAPPPGKVEVTWAPNHGIRDGSLAANAFVGRPWTYTVDPNLVLGVVEISEFMASNGGGGSEPVRDETGATPDWIELHNRSEVPVDLGGWFLTDDGSAPTRWKFPPANLPAWGYLLVLASGRDANVDGRLHTNFRLSANPGYLALVDPQTNVVSTFSPSYPRQYEDVSYGRDALDPSLVGYFTTPTPGRANTVRGAGFGPDIVFSRRSGTFVEPFQLGLSAADPAYEIRFVLVTDNVPTGSPAATNIPTRASPLYTGPIAVDTTVQVRARAYPKADGFWPGAPATECFVRLSPAAAAFTSDLPLVLIHNLDGGSVPSSTDQGAIVMAFEPIAGVASLAHPPALVSRAGINVRGRSTQGLPQKSFAVELWDEFNEDRDEPFLGLPAESDWVLFAQNAYDPSFLHNPLMHQLSRNVGRYSSRTRFAEVFLNTDGGSVDFLQPAGGHYHGIYTVEEKIKRGPDRVDLPRLETGVTNLPAITGGYLLKIDSADENERAFYDAYAETVIIFQDPDGLEMETPARRAQAEYIIRFFMDFGNALAGVDFADPIRGYAPFIDAISWIDHHLLNVLAMNADAFRLSGYFYKDRDQPLEMGPLWDFDRSLGTRTGDDARPFNPLAWMATTPLGGSDYGTDFFRGNNVFPNRWYERLFQDPDFWQRWIDRWTVLRRGPLADTSVFAEVDALVRQITNAHPRSITRWTSTAPRRGNVTANGYQHVFPGTFQGEIDFLKRWLGDRLNFVDTNFLAAPLLDPPPGQVAPGTSVTLSDPGSKPGTTLYYTLNGTDPRLPGGGIAPSALSATAPLVLPVDRNLRVFARHRNSAHANLTGSRNPPLSSPWSGATVATYFLAPPPLAITEIMFAPPPSANGRDDAEEFEYLELRNLGDATLDLAGFRLSGGIDFTFAATGSVTRLEPLQYVVVARNPAAFANRYPGVGPVLGPYAGNLANSGDELRLVGPLEEPILDLAYDDAWYPATDGAGYALVAKDERRPPGTGSDPAAWRPGAERLGSPGRADPPPPDLVPVLVNEALSRTEPPALDAIELRNPTDRPADLGGWFLTDDPGQPRKYRIPDGTILPAGGYLVFDESQFGSGADGFALGALGDEAYLFSGDGTQPTGYAHGFAFGPAATGVTFGRHVDSLGREHFVPQSTTTLGAPNAGPRIGPVILAEILFQPPPSGAFNDTLHEFVEVRNIGPQPVPLFDPSHPANTWKLAGGVEFAFPPGLELAPNGFLVVVGFDPASDPAARAKFVERYPVPDTAVLLGPFAGNLANEGEAVGLYRPGPPQIEADPFPGFVPDLLVEQVRYQPTAPWPVGVDGTGQSLRRRTPFGFADDPAQWTSADPTPGAPGPDESPTDADGDGLPDEWERRFGLRTDRADGDDGPFGDPDRDGSTNRQEYDSGTSPTDPASRLAIDYAGTEDGTIVLRFGAVAGRTYGVLVASSLEPGAWTRLTSVAASPEARVVEVRDEDHGDALPRFYRLVTP